MAEVFVAAPDIVPRVPPRLLKSGRELGGGTWYLADVRHERDFVEASRRTDTVFFVGKRSPLLLTREKPQKFSVFFQIPDDERRHRAWVEPSGKVGMRWCEFATAPRSDGTVGFLARGTILGITQNFAIGSLPTIPTITPETYRQYVNLKISLALKKEGIPGIAKLVLAGAGVLGLQQFLSFLSKQKGSLPQRMAAASNKAGDLLSELAGRKTQPGTAPAEGSEIFPQREAGSLLEKMVDEKLSADDAAGESGNTAPDDGDAAGADVADEPGGAAGNDVADEFPLEEPAEQGEMMERPSGAQTRGFVSARSTRPARRGELQTLLESQGRSLRLRR